MGHKGMNVGDPAQIDFLRTFWSAGRSREEGVTSEDVDPDELRVGELIEREHTTDPDIARKIALDHLAEYPNYYSGLVWLELLLETRTLGEAKDLVRKHTGMVSPTFGG